MSNNRTVSAIASTQKLWQNIVATIANAIFERHGSQRNQAGRTLLSPTELEQKSNTLCQRIDCNFGGDTITTNKTNLCGQSSMFCWFPECVWESSMIGVQFAGKVYGASVRETGHCMGSGIWDAKWNQTPVPYTCEITPIQFVLSSKGGASW